MVRADANDKGALLPESVLSTHEQVIGHGSPRYRARPLLGLLSDFPFGGNQGGTANMFVPEAVVGSGIFLFERSILA